MGSQCPMCGAQVSGCDSPWIGNVLLCQAATRRSGLRTYVDIDPQSHVASGRLDSIPNTSKVFLVARGVVLADLLAPVARPMVRPLLRHPPRVVGGVAVLRQRVAVGAGEVRAFAVRVRAADAHLARAAEGAG